MKTRKGDTRRKNKKDRIRSAFINQPWNHVVPPVDKGSVAIWTFEIARLLATDADVAVMSRKDPDTRKTSKHDGVDYLRVAAWPEPFGLIDRFRKRFVGYDIPNFAARNYYSAYFRRAARSLACWHPDVVHVQNLFQALPVLRDKVPKARIVLHMHCEWLSQLPGEYVSEYLQSGDWIATCSDHVREALVLALPEWANRSSTLPNGVDTSTIAIGNNLRALRKSKTILFVGRISPEKGIHVLIEAFKKIAKDFKEARLLIVGPEAPTPEEFLVDISADPTVQGLRCFYGGESYASILRKQVPNWLVERVSFLGAVGHTELPALYREAAMLVNPSLSESFGMSVIEAMACGCPVVVAQTGGMKSIVKDGVNGIVAPANDARALADCMFRILSDPALARDFTDRAAAQTIELYDWSKVTTKTLELHRRLVEESG